MSLLLPLAGISLCGWMIWKIRKDHVESQKKWDEWERQLIEDTKNLAYRSAAQSLTPPYMRKKISSYSWANSPFVTPWNAYLLGNGSTAPFTPSGNAVGSSFFSAVVCAPSEDAGGMVLRVFRLPIGGSLALGYGYSNGRGHDANEVIAAYDLAPEVNEVMIQSIDGKTVIHAKLEDIPLW